ncbi:MAG TPA: sulfite exporter TauE/SafE family protein [Actinomycetota bacterium]|jgi:ABC-type nickel/cobalt efflux system permease component RcnA
MMRPLRRLGVIVFVAGACLLLPGVATAHPLGNFTVNTYAEIELTPGSVRVDYVLDLAEIPTVQVRPQIDADGDGRVSQVERSAWATETAESLGSSLTLTIDGDEVTLDVVSASIAFRPGQGGLDVLRLDAVLRGAAPTAGTLVVSDDTFAERVGWREIVVRGGPGVAIARSTVPARSVTDALRSYPSDLLTSPLDVREATASYRPGAGAPAPTAGGAEASRDRPGEDGGAFAGLVGRTGPFMVVALLMAFGFGALHALGPGHGKTLMAAYLVGSGGHIRQAIAIGGSVALMHTASVLALGFVVLSATEAFTPERVYPWLGLASGAVALALGAGLLVARLRARNRPLVEHHAHPHEHRHAHPHEPHRASPTSRRGLMALAAAGGLLPSPTALVVLLAALALDRLAYGLALVAAFSLGLAAALVVVGVVALRAGDVVSRRLSSRIARLIPLTSASAIAVVGLGLLVRGIAQI